MRNFSRFIGISLGGGRGKTTAISRLEIDSDGTVLAEARPKQGMRGGGVVDVPDGKPFRDEALLEYLHKYVDDKTAVAVDVPLQGPPCLSCQLICPGAELCNVPAVRWMRRHAQAISVAPERHDRAKPWFTPYANRPTELLASRLLRLPHDSTGQGVSPLLARAIYLRRAMGAKLRLNENLIEVRPRLSISRLLGSRYERKTRIGEALERWEWRKSTLRDLMPYLRYDRVWPELLVRNVHVFYAVIAAFTAMKWSAENWQGPTDVKEEAKKRGDEALSSAADGWMEQWIGESWIWIPRIRRQIEGENTE